MIHDILMNHWIWWDNVLRKCVLNLFSLNLFYLIYKKMFKLLWICYLTLRMKYDINIEYQTKIWILNQNIDMMLRVCKHVILTFVFETSKLDIKDDWNMLINFSKKVINNTNHKWHKCPHHKNLHVSLLHTSSHAYKFHPHVTSHQKKFVN